MKRILLLSASFAFLALGSAAPASAGCVTGAIVGGIAGHLVGHGGVGAAAGCAYGVHRAHRTRDEQLDTGRSSARDSDYHQNRY